MELKFNSFTFLKSFHFLLQVALFGSCHFSIFFFVSFGMFSDEKVIHGGGVLSLHWVHVHGGLVYFVRA